MTRIFSRSTLRPYRRRSTSRRAVLVVVVTALVAVVLQVLAVPMEAQAYGIGSTARVPNADGTRGSFTQVGCTSTTYYDCVDETIASTDGDTTYLAGPNGPTIGGNTNSSQMFLQLTDMPADFLQAVSVSLKARHRWDTSGNDTISMGYEVFQSDETTAMTNEQAFTVAASYATDTAALSLSGANTKTAWNGARVRIKQNYTKVSGADTTSKGRISTLEVTLTYDSDSGGLRQTSFILEGDDGVTPNGNTQLAAGGTGVSVEQNTKVTARLQITNTGPAVASTSLGVFQNPGDGIYTRAGSTGPSFGSACAADATYRCETIESSSGQYASIAFDNANTPLIASYNASDLRVAQWVGTGGTGCTSTAWTCTAVDTTNDVGRDAAVAFDSAGTAWIAYFDNTNSDLRVAKYVGSGGTGCASSAWTCTTVDSTGVVGAFPSIAIDSSGNPWVSSLLSSSADLRVAKYVGGTGGTGCASSAWTCTTVDTTGTVGQYTALAIDANDNPWVAFYDSTNSALRIARYVTSNGSGCAVTSWSCSNVGTMSSATSYISMAMDAAGAPWVLYFNGGVRAAHYVGGGGSGCTATTWSCTNIDSNGAGTASIAMDVADNPWISYYDTTNSDLRTARFVGSGGTGCTSSAWTCTTVDSSGSVGLYNSIALDNNGNPWIGYYYSTSSQLRVAALGRTPALTVATSSSQGSNGAVISESHSDMTSTSDSANRTDADCSYAGASWNNGALSLSNSYSGFTMSIGSTTPQCTEMQYVIDTSATTIGQNYILATAVATTRTSGRTQWQAFVARDATPVISITAPPGACLDQRGSIWEGDDGGTPDGNTQLAAGNTSISSPPGTDLTARVQVRNTCGPQASTTAGLFSDNNDNIYTKVGSAGIANTDADACNTALFSCNVIDGEKIGGSTIGVSDTTTTTPWVSFQDEASTSLYVGHYLGPTTFTGTGCPQGPNTWDCFKVDVGGNIGMFSAIAEDLSNNPWVVYTDSTNQQVKVATYVGTGGNCGSAAFECTALDGGYTYVDIDSDSTGAPWVVYRDLPGTMRIAHYVGSGGTGCLTSAWTCTTVGASSNDGFYAQIDVDSTDHPWVTWTSFSDYSLHVAKHVGTGGNCYSTAWMCYTVFNTQIVGNSSIAVTSGGTAYVTFYDQTQGDLELAQYVGTGGTGCASTAWTCITLYPTGNSGTLNHIAIDGSGVPTIAATDYTNTRWLVGRMVAGSGCFSSAWTCKVLKSGLPSTSAMGTVNGSPWLLTSVSGYLDWSQYVGTGGSGCSPTDWTCSQFIGGSQAGGYWSSMAVGTDDEAVVSYFDYVNNKLSVARHTSGSGSGCASVNWTCEDIDAFNISGSYSSIGIDQTNAPWISYYESVGGNLRVAKYVGSGGTGCTSTTTWTCTAVDSTNETGWWTSLVITPSGAPWVSYFDNTNGDLHVAKYVGSGGTGCTSAAWTCTTVDSTNDVGSYSHITTDSAGTVWISYLDATNGDLRVAKYVGSAGTGCASSAWTCTTVASSNVTGYASSIAIGPQGTPWVSYIDTTTNGLQIAEYTPSGGTGCASSAWTCTSLVTGSVTGDRTSLAFDAAGRPWITTSGYGVVAVHYVGSGGSNCSTSAWQCDDLGSMGDGNPGAVSSLAFTATGAPVISAFGNGAQYLRFITVDRANDFQASVTSSQGSNGASVTQSHADMTTTSDSANRTDADCLVSGTYSSGKLVLATTTSGFTLGDGRTTPTCTEYSFVIDDTSVDVSTTHRFVVSYATTANYSRQSWMGPTTLTNTPTMTVQAANTAPNTPSALAQTKTTTTAISTGGWTNETSVRFTATVSDTNNPDTVALCVEVQALGIPFTDTETGCGSTVAYSGTGTTATVTLGSLVNGTQYHWQARTKDAGGLYSSWTSYGGNAEAASDVGVDTTAPAAGTVYDGASAGVDAGFNSGSLSALDANWSGFTDATSGVASYEYSIGTTAGATDIRTWTAAGSTSVAATSLTLHTSVAYAINVRAIDAAGNTGSVASSNGQLVGPTLTFALSDSTVTLGPLTALNSYTGTDTLTTTVSTNAYAGYVIRQAATSALTNGATQIADFGASYASPATWSGDGFGYTSSDTSIQGSGNLFGTGTKYAALASSMPGDIVADHTASIAGTPVTNESFTLSYRVSVPPTQLWGTYTTTFVFTAVATY